MIERLEAALRRVLEEPFARLFPGRLHPLEIAASLRDAARESRLRTGEGIFVANTYVVHLALHDWRQLQSLENTVCIELARHVRSYAEGESWIIGPYVTVALQPDPNAGAGQIHVEAQYAQCPESAYLVVEAGLADRKRLPLGTEAVIGRGGNCDIVIPTPEVSRQHCRLSYKYVQYEIEDLGSANGTYLNGASVTRAFVGDRDLIEIGLVQLRFHAE